MENGEKLQADQLVIQDALYDPTGTNLRAKLLIEGAGHWIQQERPAEVNAALLRFLAADYPA